MSEGKASKKYNELLKKERAKISEKEIVLNQYGRDGEYRKIARKKAFGIHIITQRVCGAPSSPDNPYITDFSWVDIGDCNIVTLSDCKQIHKAWGKNE